MKIFSAALAAALFVSSMTHAADLLVYSAGPKPLSSDLAAGFTAKTGIKVDLFQSNSGKVMSRYQAEKSNPQVDVIITAAWGHAITLDKDGDLLAYTSPNAVNIPASLKTNTYAAQGAAALAIAYNTKSGLPAPAEWDDLTKPEYKDQVTMPDPSKSGSALSLVEGLVAQRGDDAWKLFGDLHRNGMILPGANKAALNPVLQGAKGVVFGAVDYIVLGQKAKGESIEVIHPKGGTVLAPRAIMIMKTSKNQDAAKQFVDYVLSDEGQGLVAKRLIIPARTDVTAKRPGWDDLNIIDFDFVKAAEMAVETKQKFADIVK